jgi:tetratricopeptide (TPR) repeat protein
MSDYKYYLDNGIYDVQDGNFKQAIEKFDKSIELKNDFEITYFYRAVANQALKNYDEAMLDYTKSIKINPKMTDAYYNMAEIILTRKDIINQNIPKAIEYLEKALELDDKFIDALFAMAAAYKKLGDYHKALEYLEKLLKIEPQAVNAKALKKLILQKYIL